MIAATDLHKFYGSLQAVAGVSLEIEPGETFGLLGPNGAGKSTTIHLMAGLLRPDRGQITRGLPLPTPRRTWPSGTADSSAWLGKRKWPSIPGRQPAVRHPDDAA
jgi:ABC-type uncharacterized transport system ATPase subunit